MASQIPPAITPRVDPVNRAAHASVPVSPVSSATRRASASANIASLNAATCASNAASSATPSPSSNRSNTPNGTAPAASIDSRADAIHDATTGR